MVAAAKARRSRTSGSLGVWMNGAFVGTWTVRPDAASTLEYSPEWLVLPEGRPISLSLPFRPDGKPHQGPTVEFFFDNLLPESPAIRKRIQDQFALRSVRAFDLLAAIGRDCAGAVQILPRDETPEGWNRIDARPLSDAEVERQLLSVPEAVPTTQAQENVFRISALAGAQEKTTFLWHANHWHVPLGATPSTHIFKLPLGRVGNMQVDLSTSVENEWLCSQIVAAYGLPIAACRIAIFGKAKALIVERFDRRLEATGPYWLRLPQEDMCQALGVPASAKYEADGGPGMKDILRVLASSQSAESDRRAFLKTQILFWMLAATDGHAKNFSLHIDSGGRYRGTPLYDVISAWPIIGRGANQLAWQDASLAMAVHSRNLHYRLSEIQRRHWNTVAHADGVGENAESLIRDLLDATPRVLAEVGARLPTGFPGVVADKILQGLQSAAQKLERMVPERSTTD